MKKLIILLCFLVSQLTFSQKVGPITEKTSISIDNTVIPIFEEFIKEGKKRGFYLRFFLMERIDYIVFLKDFGGTEEDPRIGVIGNDYRSIYLSPTLKENPLLLKITVFHEIGHIIKYSGEHTCINCYNIMSEYAPETLEPYTNEKFWQYKLDEYFKWLNGK